MLKLHSEKSLSVWILIEFVWFVSKCINVRARLFMYMKVWVCMCVWVHFCVRVFVYLYLCLCAHVLVCVYVDHNLDKFRNDSIFTIAEKHKSQNEPYNKPNCSFKQYWIISMFYRLGNFSFALTYIYIYLWNAFGQIYTKFGYCNIISFCMICFGFVLLLSLFFWFRMKFMIIIHTHKYIQILFIKHIKYICERCHIQAYRHSEQIYFKMN